MCMGTRVTSFTDVHFTSRWPRRARARYFDPPWYQRYTARGDIAMISLSSLLESAIFRGSRRPQGALRLATGVLVDRHMWKGASAGL